MRRHHGNILLTLSITALLTACGGGGGSISDGEGGTSITTSQPPPAPAATVPVGGSIGDGPVVGADVIVRDATGQEIARTQSDATASYTVPIPEDAMFPVTIESSGGQDVVTNRQQDFTMVSVRFRDASTTANVTPMSTLLVRALQCAGETPTPAGLSALAATVYNQYSFGLDTRVVPDLVTAPVNEVTAAPMVKSNEGVAEWLRRTTAASPGMTADQVLETIACDLVDGLVDGLGPNGTIDGRAVAPSEAVAGMAAAELPSVLLELMTNQLRVKRDNNPNAEVVAQQLDDAISVLLPNSTGLSTESVALTDALIEETRRTVNQLLALSPDGPLVALAAGFDGLRSGTSAADSRRVLADLSMLPAVIERTRTTLATATDSERREFLDAARRSSLPPAAPTLQLDYSPRGLASGDIATVSWTTTGAVACTGEDDVQAANLDAQGSISTGPVRSPLVATLICFGPGGSVRSSIPVEPSANGSALPQITNFSVQPAIAPFGQNVLLSWRAEGATSCRGENDVATWQTDLATVGSSSQGPITEQTTFTLVCSNDIGTSRRNARVGSATPALPPTVQFAADSSQISTGETVRLSWSSLNSDSCTATSTGQLNDWTGTVPLAGIRDVAPGSSPTTFSLTCGRSDGTTLQRSLTVTQLDVPVVSLTADRTRVGPTGTLEVDWNVDNADSCVASAVPATSQWTGARSPSRTTQILGPLTSSTTITLTCTNGDSAAASDSLALELVAGALVNLSANRTSVPIEGGVELSWVSTSTNTCNANATPASAIWSGALPPSGTRQIDGLLVPTSFSLTCSGVGGTDTDTRAVNIVARPTIELTAAPAVVAIGGTTTLTWNSTGATSCTASGAWTGSRSTSGSVTVSNLLDQRRYTLACTGSGGETRRSLDLAPGTVGIAWTAPTENADGSPLTDLTGYSVKLGRASRVYTRADSVPGANNTRHVFDLVESGTYYMAVTAIDSEQNESPRSKEIMVVVGGVLADGPTVSLTGTPSPIPSGGTLTLVWNASNADTCTASGAWNGSRGTSGSLQIPSLTQPGTYVLTCTGSGGVTSDQFIASTVATPQVDLQASALRISAGDPLVLTWTSSAVDTCVASDGWNGSRTIQSQETLLGVTESSNFTLTCQGPGGVAESTVFVAVEQVSTELPEVFLSATPTVVAPGGTATLNWVTNLVTNCAASGAWNGAKLAAGTEGVLPSGSSAAYTLTCTGPSGPVSSTAKVAVSGTSIPGALTQFIVVDSGTGTGRGTTIGMPFAEGAVASGSDLVVVDSNGTPLPTQWNPLASWRTDGSVLHGAVTFITGSGDVSGVYGLRPGDSNSGAPVSKQDVVDAGFDAEIRVVTDTGDYRISARDLLTGAVQARQDHIPFAGPLVTEFVLGAPLREVNSDAPHSAMQGFFHIRAYGKPVSNVYVSVIVENTGVFNALADTISDVYLNVGQEERYRNLDFNLKADARYSKRYWWQTDPGIFVQHDVEYLQNTKLLPEYREVVINENTLSDFPQSVDWHGIGQLQPAMDGAGAQAHIAPLDRWTAAYLISGDQRAYNAMLAHDDAYHWAAHKDRFAVHPRDENTGFPLDMAQNSNLIGNSWGGPNAMAATRQTKVPLQFDHAHQPEVGYVPYLLTAEFDRLEQSQFWAIYPWHRTGTTGWPRRFIGRLQIRGLAWSLRNMISAAIITPDNHPLKDTLDGAVSNVFTVWNDEYRPTSSFGAIINGSGNSEAVVYSNNSTPNPNDTGTPVGFAPWMDDFITYAVGTGYERGWKAQLDASGFWDWKAQFPVRRGSSGGEFCWIHASILAYGIRDTPDSPYYGTLGEIFQKNYPETQVCPPAGQASLFTRDTSAQNLGAQYQAVLSVVVSTGYPGAAEAYDTMERRIINWFIDFDTSPEWALQPRQ